MNSGRRVIVCVAAGLALAVVAAGVNRLLASTPEGGWFIYSPETEPPFPPPSADSDVIRAGLVWLVAVGVWLVISWWLFGDRRR
jgi:hypothetical protein